MSEKIDHPAHYNANPARCECGAAIECITVAEHFGFNLGNALKYIWRCDHKDDAIEDLEKAIWCLRREVQRRKDSGPRREAPDAR